MPMHEDEGVVLALMDKAADACEQANVKSTHSLVLHQSFMISPIDHADFVIVDGCTEAEAVSALPDLTGDVLWGRFGGLNPWYRRRRFRQVGSGGGFAALDRECAGVCDGDRN